MTLDQKFILLLSTDEFFKDECQFVRKEWELPQNEIITSVIKESQQYDLPLQYKRDLRFILNQSKLPERYLWPLHKYLLTQRIPTIKNLPPPVRIFTRHNPLTGIGMTVIEIDVDAGKKEISGVFNEIYYAKTFLQKANDINKIFQPIRDFDGFLKRTKSRSLDSHIDLDEIWKVGVDDRPDYAAMKKITRSSKNKWRVQILRSKMSLSKGKKLSIRDREKLEDYYKKLDSEMEW